MVQCLCPLQLLAGRCCFLGSLYEALLKHFPVANVSLQLRVVLSLQRTMALGSLRDTVAVQGLVAAQANLVRASSKLDWQE